jgi:hypothetical protein
VSGGMDCKRHLHRASAAKLCTAKDCSGAKVRDLRTRCNQWTRTQRIRTAAAIPVVVAIVDAASTPVHLEIDAKATHLRELGLSDRAIARAIGVSDKTVAKSLRRTSTGSGHDAHHAQLQGEAPG